MDSIINSILAVMPQGLWEKIIVAFEGAFGSFALSIIILTIIIKLVLSPIDFFNRRTNSKMASMQKKVQKQVEAISKKYEKDPKTKNQKLGELYQREKINPVGSCVVMLVNLALTMTVFITLFNGMNAMASYKIANEFEQLQIEYVQEYAQSTDGVDIVALIKENENKKDDDTTKKSIYEICKPYVLELKSPENAELKTQADAKVAKKYKETKEGFLWIDNIWLADSPFKKSVPSFKDFTSVARVKTKNDEEYKEYEAIYEQIMTPLRETNGRVNGYFILVIISAGVAFLNQWLAARRAKKEGQGKSSIVMYIVMPLMMAIFTLLYTTMFSLYIITSQIVSIAIMPLTAKISDAIDKHQAKKNEPTDRLKRI